MASAGIARCVLCGVYRSRGEMRPQAALEGFQGHATALVCEACTENAEPGGQTHQQPPFGLGRALVVSLVLAAFLMAVTAVIRGH